MNRTANPTLEAVAARPGAAMSTGRRSPWRLGRTPHKVALTAHVLTSVGWFGIAAVMLAGALAAIWATPPVAQDLYRGLEAAPWLSIPFGLASIATGALLGLGTRYGLVRNWWVVAKMAISVVVVLTDAVVVRAQAHSALVAGMSGGSVIGPTAAHVVALTVATVLSVFKPRGVTPWARRRAGA
jgi:hypothetical protein